MKKSMLDSSDVFIMDLGLKLFQYNGATANKDEKYKAVQYMQDLKSKRPKADTETLEENELVSIQYIMDIVIILSRSILLNKMYWI